MVRLSFVFFASILCLFYPVQAVKITTPKQLPNETYVKLDRVQCECAICNTTWCRVKFIDRYTQTLNAVYSLSGTIDHMRVHVTAYYRFTTYRKFLIDIDHDFCDYMGNRTINQPLLSVIMPIFSAASNINHPCPYSGNVTITGLRVSTAFVDFAIVPSGQYRADFVVHGGNSSDSYAWLKVYLTVPVSNNAHIDKSMG